MACLSAQVKTGNVELAMPSIGCWRGGVLLYSMATRPPWVHTPRPRGSQSGHNATASRVRYVHPCASVAGEGAPATGVGVSYGSQRRMPAGPGGRSAVAGESAHTDPTRDVIPAGHVALERGRTRPLRTGGGTDRGLSLGAQVGLLRGDGVGGGIGSAWVLMLNEPVEITVDQHHHVGKMGCAHKAEPDPMQHPRRPGHCM